MAGVGYLDAYVAGIFLEIDGHAHHSDPTAFERDRQRDLAARRLGLQVLRISYDQIWHQWDLTRQPILETISQAGALGRRRARQAGLGPSP